MTSRAEPSSRQASGLGDARDRGASDRPGHPLIEAVFGAIAEAARQRCPAPTHDQLAFAAGCGGGQARYALNLLLKRGRVRRIGIKNQHCFEIPELGLSTAPAINRATRRWTVKSDLTPPQRQALSAARRLIHDTGSASIADVARALVITPNAARDRLVRVAGFGFLSQRPDGRFGPAAAEDHAAAEQTRVEIRDGVRVTVCPPRFAQGALLYRPMPGLGGPRRSGR